MQRPDDWQLRLIQLLAVFGMFVAYFLLLFHRGDLIGVCEPGGFEDCGQVSGPGAPYSAIGPIPVALIGLVGYIVIFLAVWLKDWIAALDDYMPEIMVGLTGLAFVFTLYLTSLELFIIHAVCRYCLISAGIVTLQLILAIFYMRHVNSASD
ncbi:MAG: vitamin K epoxide reductase family protein [Ardenticatenaceae bacterium]|nr:vitamin K epoxide reductase family protein [Ardenticatenaceae bacterium]